MRILVLGFLCVLCASVVKDTSEPDRSPVDLVLSPDGRYLFTANQSSDSISQARLSDGRIVAEVPCGRRPANLAITPDGRNLLVSASYAGDVIRFDIDGESLKRRDSVHVSFEPRGLAIGVNRLFVALASGECVAELDQSTLKEIRRIEVGRWPRELALSPDGTRLAVGVSGDGGVAVVDTVAGKRLYREQFVGLNLGQMQVSRDGHAVYFPWTIYRMLPVTANNISQGWVLGSRIGRVKLNERTRREAITLDPQGQAVADPAGLALSADESHLYCTAAGSRELLIYRLNDLPFQDYGNPDHIHPDLLKDRDRFFRLPLGGRPMAIRVANNGHLFIANALLNAVQEVDPVAKRIVRTISLGGPAEPSEARRGESIFFDARRSHDQWYSCHTCHFEGGTNAVAMDTRNDGRSGNFKTVLSLHNVTKTGPWTWHGWQKELGPAVKKSMIDSMLGPLPADDDVSALVAYLDTLKPPPNPHRHDDAVTRGEAVFRSEKADCIRCHSGPYFTDGKIHTVGLEDRGDAYKGYNSPSLVHVFDRPRLLHDGRAKSLHEVLTKYHNPDAVVGRGELTPQELADLIAYLKSL